MKIKVLHLGYSDDYGGASIAMIRIHKAISLNPIIDSKIAVICKSTINDEVYSLSKTFWEIIWTYFRVRIAYKIVKLFQKTRNPSGRSINFFPSSVIKRIDAFDCDIIHLHWIGNETIRIEDLKKIKQPIVWTFHDKWAMLGAEYTDLSQSDRFVNGYNKSNCPPGSRGLDVDKWVWERKYRNFKELSIKPIAVSSWLLNETKKSLIWKDANAVVINNPIAKTDWEVKDKMQCKVEMNFPLDAMIIGFGAVNPLTDKLKGFALLEKALDKISKELPEKKIFCIIFGNDDLNTINKTSNLSIRLVGKIKDSCLLNKIYSACDVFVVPSYFETFGQVALESVCCGTPVACFKTSGLIDVIKNEINGIFAAPFDTESLADAIIRASDIKLKNVYIEEFAVKFSYEKIGAQYITVYKEVLNK